MMNDELSISALENEDINSHRFKPNNPRKSAGENIEFSKAEIAE
jgi:hypothetical protein